MVPWWGTLLACLGFALWSCLCILIGAALSMNANRKLDTKKSDPRMN